MINNFRKKLPDVGMYQENISPLKVEYDVYGGKHI